MNLTRLSNQLGPRITFQSIKTRIAVSSMPKSASTNSTNTSIPTSRPTKHSLTLSIPSWRSIKTNPPITFTVFYTTGNGYLLKGNPCITEGQLMNSLMTISLKTSFKKAHFKKDMLINWKTKVLFLKVPSTLLTNKSSRPSNFLKLKGKISSKYSFKPQNLC